MKRKLIIALAAMLFFTASIRPASAFSDLEGEVNREKILQLKKAGILKGETDGRFYPAGDLTGAAGITAIISAMDLSLAKFLFIKEPKASDYFTKADDGAWYANALTIAHVNGMDLPKDFSPGAALTREEFAYYLLKGLQASGDYAFTEMYFLIKDEEKIAPQYRNSIQTLLNGGIRMLDKDHQFQPKKKITRAEAAGWLYDAYSIKNRANSLVIKLDLFEKPLAAGMNEVTIQAQLPHPGYGLRIMQVEYEGKNAMISYQVLLPDPDLMFPQVVTDVSAKVKIKAGFKPVLREMPPVFAETE